VPQFKQKITKKPPQRFIKAVLLNAAFYAKALSALLYAKNDSKNIPKRARAQI